MAQETIQQVVEELRQERDRIDRALRALDGISGGENTKSPRRTGRKPMSAAARKAVSLRMSRYWAKRRAMKAKGAKKGGARKAA